jgi:predicted Ser/Thr protein kinase
MDHDSWERVKDALAEAVRRPPSERHAFVESLSLPRPIHDKVIEILSAWNDSEGFLLSDNVPHASIADALLPPGTRVGPYEIIDLLGEGGMGRVYLASDKQLRRRVALKCLKSRADATIIKEGVAAARINHPNVAAVYHVVEHLQRVFIVMEYVDGENLAERLRRERLSTLQAVLIGQSLCSALAAAHAKGIIHRDLKPGNVQFTRDGTPKVLDFGIANLALTMTLSSNASTAGPTISPAGPHPGTPPYMSPEQLRGRELDERSDIFSLGVVLFEMATGRRPFLSGDRQEIQELQVSGAPRADSVDAKVPRTFADVIARSLETDRLRRTQSAREVEAGLEDVARRMRPKVVRELVRQGLTRVAIGVPIGVALVGLVGLIVTAGYNTTFGRDAEFARFGVEPFTAYFAWGLLAIFPSVVVMAMTAAAFLAARAAFRVLEAAGPVGRVLHDARRKFKIAVHGAGLDTSPILAQVLAGFGVLVVAILFWNYSALVNAWSALINSAPLERLAAIGPQAAARAQYHRFQITLHVLIVILAFGLIKVLQLRRAEGARESPVGIAALAVVLALIVVMLNVTYRTMNHRDLEVINLPGLRCYITGQTADEFLVFCPQSNPPRNRAFKRAEIEQLRTGRLENVFESLRPQRPRS